MTIILFLVDTSASMNQRSYLGTTILDTAKASVETFMKIRSHDPNSRWDRYMLLTFEEPPMNIKAGWKESHAVFMQELKFLECNGLTTVGPSLKYAFDLLNVNRMQTGIDTYGQGRCPFFLEPAVVFVLTDGGRLVTQMGVQKELNLPMNAAGTGAELTGEPFRWDQRIFGLVLAIPGCIPMDQGNAYIPAAENTPLDAMCDVTGGRSYKVSSQRQLNAALESLAQKIQSGVVINFEKVGPDPPSTLDAKPEGAADKNGNCKENQDVNCRIMPLAVTPDETKRVATPLPHNIVWHSCRRMIYVQRSAQKGHSIGHWPIPEAFWPDPNSTALPARAAQPVINFACSPCEPAMIENLPFDKYELEPSPLTQFILERKQPSVCWQVYVAGSCRPGDQDQPFGYIKASNNLSCVNLFVMPYNYPVLLPLLDEYFKVLKLKPTPKWRKQFDTYLKRLPAYYIGPLRRALSRMGVPNLVPDNAEEGLSYSVISYLKKLKNQAKIEMDRVVASVGHKVPLYDGVTVVSRSKPKSLLERKDFNKIMEKMGNNMSNLKKEITEFDTFKLAVADRGIRRQFYRNPYDIPKRQLIDQIARMRINFLQTKTVAPKLIDEDQLHSISIQQMGNYQEYLKLQPAPLREIENQPVRLHMFGNPFKVNKNTGIMLDEAEDAALGNLVKNKRSLDSPPSSPCPRKRKPGPLASDFVVRRPFTPPPGSPAALALLTQQQQSPIVDTDDSDDEESQLIIQLSDSEDEASSSSHAELLENNTDAAKPLTNDLAKPSQNHIGSIDVAFEPIDKVTKIADGLTNSHSFPNSVINKSDAKVWNYNCRLRHLVYKELKKPGRKYDALFSQLSSVRGSIAIRRHFIRDVIHEASRFKKRVLVRLLEQYEASLTKAESKKSSLTASSVT